MDIELLAPRRPKIKIKSTDEFDMKPQILKLLFSGKGIDFVRTNGFLPKGKHPSQLLR